MRILVDLDGVCADFYKRLVAWYNRDFGDSLTPGDVTTWAIGPTNFPKARREDLRAYFDVPGFWEGLDPIAGCRPSLKRLHDAGHDIVIATAVPKESRMALYEKKRWVKKHLPFIKPNSVVGISRKYLLNGDLLLDDGPNNIKEFPGVTCIMDASYNQRVRANYRVRSWKMFEKVVELESRKQ